LSALIFPLASSIAPCKAVSILTFSLNFLVNASSVSGEPLESVQSIIVGTLISFPAVVAAC